MDQRQEVMNFGTLKRDEYTRQTLMESPWFLALLAKCPPGTSATRPIQLYDLSDAQHAEICDWANDRSPGIWLPERVRGYFVALGVDPEV